MWTLRDTEKDGDSAATVYVGANPVSSVCLWREMYLVPGSHVDVARRGWKRLVRLGEVGYASTAHILCLHRFVKEHLTNRYVGRRGLSDQLVSTLGTVVR